MATDVSEVAAAAQGLEIDGPQPGTNLALQGPEPTMLSEEQEPQLPAKAETAEALFDSGAFLAVPTMDGQATDTLKLAFGGGIDYESTSAEGRKIFDKFSLGATFELRVAGRVVKKSGAWKEKADDTEVVTGVVALKVDTVYLLTPEEL